MIVKNVKGAVEKNILVKNDEGGCGLPIKINALYIIYAYKNPSANDLWVSQCAGTKLLFDPQIGWKHLNNGE
jgi:hypothetical protein